MQNDPMAALINSLPQQPQGDNGSNGNLFQQQPQMFGPETQQPYYPPQQNPAPQQPLPQQQPVYQQQPPAPQHQQSGQQQQGPQNEYPITVPFQQQPQDQVPTWAQGLVEQVNNLQQQTQHVADDQDWPNKGKTWGEFRQAVRKEAEEIAKAQLDTYKQQQTQAQQQEEESMRAANQQLDNAVVQLRQGGFLPPITNPTDPNDAGKLAERELYAYTVSTGGQDAQALLRAAPTLRALHDSGVYFDYTQQKLVRRGSQSAAASAPIAGAAPSFGNGAPGAQGGPSNRQIANMSMDQLMAMGMNLNQ